jgi:hypothetical protein
MLRTVSQLHSTIGRPAISVSGPTLVRDLPEAQFVELCRPVP